jgi:hypothetical protein
MRILFMRPLPAIPESFAGTQVNLHWLCRQLVANNHEVILAAATNNVTDGAVNVDRQCGYPVYRAPHVFRSARAATVKFKPEIVVVTQPGPWLGQLPEAICKTPMVIYGT